MRKAKIEDHLDNGELNTLLEEHKDSYNIYRRVLLIKMVKNGDTIKRASEIIGINRKTGERWVKQYNEEGMDGLLTKYHNCGKKSKLDDEKLEMLKDYIITSNQGFTIEDVRDLILCFFGIEFSYNHVWFITRKKMGLNYGKPFIKYDERTEEDMEVFKKN